MPEDTIASAAWRIWTSVIPRPKLFQLFHPQRRGERRAARRAVAVEWEEAVTDAVTVSTAVPGRRSSRPPDRLGTYGSFR